MTLAEVMPYEFIRGEYNDTPAYVLKDHQVKSVHCMVRDGDDYERWPGPQKNVVTWVILDNGKRVGWNENVNTGWSFPVLGKERKMTPIIITGDVEKKATVEDDGCAKIVGLDNLEVTGGDEDLFVMLHSWNDDFNSTLRHRAFNRLLGRKVRITIEVIE